MAKIALHVGFLEQQINGRSSELYYKLVDVSGSIMQKEYIIRHLLAYSELEIGIDRMIRSKGVSEGYIAAQHQKGITSIGL